MPCGAGGPGHVLLPGAQTAAPFAEMGSFGGDPNCRKISPFPIALRLPSFCKARCPPRPAAPQTAQTRLRGSQHVPRTAASAQSSSPSAGRRFTAITSAGFPCTWQTFIFVQEIYLPRKAPPQPSKPHVLHPQPGSQMRQPPPEPLQNTALGSPAPSQDPRQPAGI